MCISQALRSIVNRVKKNARGGGCAVVAFDEQRIIKLLFYATEMVYICFHNFYNCDVSQKCFICE